MNKIYDISELGQFSSELETMCIIKFGTKHPWVSLNKCNVCTQTWGSHADYRCLRRGFKLETDSYDAEIKRALELGLVTDNRGLVFGKKALGAYLSKKVLATTVSREKVPKMSALESKYGRVLDQRHGCASNILYSIKFGALLGRVKSGDFCRVCGKKYRLSLLWWLL